MRKVGLAFLSLPFLFPSPKSNMWKGRGAEKSIFMLVALKDPFVRRKLSHLIQFLALADNLVEGKKNCGRLEREFVFESFSSSLNSCRHSEWHLKVARELKSW